MGFEECKASGVEDFDITNRVEQASNLADSWSMHCDARRLQEEILRTFNLALTTPSELKSHVIRMYDQANLEITVSCIDQNTLRVCWQQKIADLPTPCPLT